MDIIWDGAVRCSAPSYTLRACLQNGYENAMRPVQGLPGYTTNALDGDAYINTSFLRRLLFSHPQTSYDLPKRSFNSHHGLSPSASFLKISGRRNMSSSCARNSRSAYPKTTSHSPKSHCNHHMRRTPPFYLLQKCTLNTGCRLPAPKLDNT